MMNLSRQWLWLDSGFASGAYHMALDAALLERAKSSDLPLFRIYGWNPRCISLGYHQSTDSLDLSSCEKQNIDVVRRPTGGRAVYHAEEITYSVIYPVHDNNIRLQDVYHSIHAGLVEGLKLLGIPAEQKKRSPDLRGHYQNALSANCFSTAARYEIVVQDRKLIGSAQKQGKHAILQHGSVLLGDAHLELVRFFLNTSPSQKKQMQRMIKQRTTSISKYMEDRIEYSAIKEALKAGIEKEFHMEFKPCSLSPETDALAISQSGYFKIQSDVMQPVEMMT